MVFSTLVILFGFFQLSNEQDIFAQSRAQCCNTGMCTYPNIFCYTSSSIILKPLCSDEYILTCKDCADYNSAGRVCGDPKNSCKDESGNCYGWCKVDGIWQWTNPI